MAILIAALASVLLSYSCVANTLLVSCEGDSWEDLVGQAVLQAATGDTILVEAGTYFEHIPLQDKGIVLKSLSGPLVTVLDGSREIPGRASAVLYTPSGNENDLLLEGFTIQNGKGTHNESGSTAGGGVGYWSVLGEARCRIIDCVFKGNEAVGSASGIGGAVYVGTAIEAEIRTCRFVDTNRSII